MGSIVPVSLSCMASWPRLSAEALLHGALCLFQKCTTSPGCLWDQARCCMFLSVCLVLDPLAVSVRLECPPDDSSSHLSSQLWFTVPCTKAGSWLLGKIWPRLLSAWEGEGLALLLWFAQQGWALPGLLVCDAHSARTGPSVRSGFSFALFSTTLPCVLCNNKYWEKLSHLPPQWCYQTLFFNDKLI